MSALYDKDHEKWKPNRMPDPYDQDLDRSLILLFGWFLLVVLFGG